ncbi:MAG: THUMP-like domain-containing protein [Alphaproteobacteria bacterium]
MDYKHLLTPDIQTFITAQADSDVRTLALKKPPNPDWPYPIILDQIKTRQKAKIKAPQLLETPNWVFPAHNVFEQASSTATALFKASLIKANSFTDLTGGAGIDSWAFAQTTKNGTVIDADETNAALLAHNLPIPAHHTTAEEFAPTMQPVDLTLIDPQRRTKKQKGLYRFEDCSPNILELLPHIKSKTIMIKASPMMDIEQGLAALPNTSDIYVIEHAGECKELLFILKKEPTTPTIHAVNIDKNGHPTHKLSFTSEEEKSATCQISAPQQYLYEPGPAFLKSGAYKTIAARYNLAKLHQHTHLYTSDTPLKNFPGRIFEIINTYPVQAKVLPFTRANLTTRNFPQSVETLRKKLKLKDGSNDYLFACTLNTGKHALLHCNKIS